MKSIGEFIASKIRRAELSDRLSVSRAGEPDLELGRFDATLLGPEGPITFFETGLRLESGARIPYSTMVWVSRAADGLEVRLDDGRMQLIRTSDAGGIAVHATLRWIGHTRLRRKIAGER